MTVTLGGSYDFGVLKAYAAAQYFNNVTGVGQKTLFKKEAGDTSATFDTASQFSENGGEGYSLGLGVPAFGGTAKAHVGYVDAEDTKDSDITFKRWNVTVGYDYSLSSRTSVYTAATYAKDKNKNVYDNTTYEPSIVEVMAGLIHKF